MVATSAELRANARAIRARLFAPANAVVDRAIDLRRPHQVVLITPPPVVPPAPRRKIPLTTARLVELVAGFYQQPIKKVLSRSRQWPVVKVRQVAGYLAKDLLHRGCVDISRAIHRSHVTVIQALESFEHRLQLDSELAYEVEQVRKHVQAEQGVA